MAFACVVMAAVAAVSIAAGAFGILASTSGSTSVSGATGTSGGRTNGRRGKERRTGERAQSPDFVSRSTDNVDTSSSPPGPPLNTGPPLNPRRSPDAKSGFEIRAKVVNQKPRCLLTGLEVQSCPCEKHRGL